MEKNFTYEALLYSSLQDLTIGKIKKGEYSLDQDVSSMQQWLENHDVSFVVEGVSNYPVACTMMSSRPYVLYYQWNLELLSRQILGVVGPRKMTKYSEQVLHQLFELLQWRDIVTISGLAEGVDTMCHEESLRQGIPTIAVLGGGFQYFLNSYRRELIERIVKWWGLVISEFKIWQQPMVYTFPQRNRIIAGLSQRLFLPEAGKDSGSLITADFAYEMKKPVYGVPNTLWSEQSQGIHEYISKGKMHLVSDLKIFVDTLIPTKNSEPIFLPNTLDEGELLVIDMLHTWEAKSLDTLVEATGLGMMQVMGIISTLELKGLIYSSGPDQYQRC